MVFPGDPGISRGLVAGDKNNFAPRLGAAWDPRGDGRLSIRAAYGLYYEDFRSDLWTYPAVNQPFVIREFVNNPASFQDPYAGRVNPFPYVYSPETAKFQYPMGLFTVIAPELAMAHMHQMSFSIEHALPFKMVGKAAYVGKRADDLIRMEQRNPATYIPGQSTLANTDARRLGMPSQYTSFREITASAGARYDSMQLSLSRRMSQGLTFMSSYTLGKFMDQYSSANLGQTSQDPGNPDAEWSRSDEDRRHVFNASFLYEFPFFRNSGGLAHVLLADWALSGMVSISSGEPVNVLSGRDFSLTGVGFDRPDLVGDPVIEHSNDADMVAKYFNTAAFVANQPGQYGNAGRNLFSGPGYSATNLSLTKAFGLPGRLGKMQVPCRGVQRVQPGQLRPTRSATHQRELRPHPHGWRTAHRAACTALELLGMRRSLILLALVFAATLRGSGNGPAAVRPDYPASRHGGTYMFNYYLPPAPSATAWSPAWSPDGKWIAVAMQGSIWKVRSGQRHGLRGQLQRKVPLVSDLVA